MQKSLFDIVDKEETTTKNPSNLFRWVGLDNRLLCILEDEAIQGDEVSCFAELNEDMSIKTKYHELYKRHQRVSRYLSMEDVERVT